MRPVNRPVGNKVSFPLSWGGYIDKAVYLLNDSGERMTDDLGNLIKIG